MTKTTSDFYFPGLPAVIEELVRLIKAPDVSVALSPVLFEAKRYLAALPAMLAEIERLESFNADLIAENERLHKSCTIEHRDYDRLRSQHAEMREALARLMEQPTMHPLALTPEERKELWAAHDQASAILSKTETEQP